MSDQIKKLQKKNNNLINFNIPPKVSKTRFFFLKKKKINIHFRETANFLISYTITTAGGLL